MQLFRIFVYLSILHLNDAFMFSTRGGYGITNNYNNKDYSSSSSLSSSLKTSETIHAEGFKATSTSTETRKNHDNHHNKSRKQFLQSMTLLSLYTQLPLLSSPQAANAAYGSSSNIELPNYIDFLIEKNTSVDQSKVLYKGADSETQLKRIADASKRLNEIPALAKEKKWSQVQGVVSGPLGTLLQTMNQLSSVSKEAAKVATKVKGDIILISQEAGKKSEDGVLKACADAQRDLEAFARLVF